MIFNCLTGNLFKKITPAGASLWLVPIKNRACSSYS